MRSLVTPDVSGVGYSADHLLLNHFNQLPKLGFQLTELRVGILLLKAVYELEPELGRRDSGTRVARLRRPQQLPPARFRHLEPGLFTRPTL